MPSSSSCSTSMHITMVTWVKKPRISSQKMSYLTKKYFLMLTVDNKGQIYAKYLFFILIDYHN